MRSRASLLIVSVAIVFSGVRGDARPDLFDSAEVSAIQKYWAEPGRYAQSLPKDSSSKGIYQVRSTADGSLWLWTYNKARGIGKTPPGQVPPPQTEEQRGWDAWIDAKIASDRYEALVQAQQKNFEATGQFLPESEFDTPPLRPGPIPEGLEALAGPAPIFAECCQPAQHTVSFDDGVKLTYQDHVPMKPRYAYYRFPQGVQSMGQHVKDFDPDALATLCKKAGISESERRIMREVSLLEGGFDSVNTYDTGYVSVGLIQFASLREGRGSLGAVMLDLKQSAPEAFNQDFHRFGIEVTPDGALAAVDPDSGAVTIGPDANDTIIRDKRLIAVFQRAGQVCQAFRVAQLRVSKARYFPASDRIETTLGGSPTRIRVGDFIKSEAGLATLMDRKVNTGKLDPLGSVVDEIVAAYDIRSLSDLTAHEYEIIARMRYRKSYLGVVSLSQPLGRDGGSETSRGGASSRSKRKKSGRR